VGIKNFYRRTFRKCRRRYICGVLSTYFSHFGERRRIDQKLSSAPKKWLRARFDFLQIFHAKKNTSSLSHYKIQIEINDKKIRIHDKLLIYDKKYYDIYAY
jgi:hypothetical protein